MLFCKKKKYKDNRGSFILSELNIRKYILKISFNHKKECIWVSSDEVDEPKPIIQSEVSQKEKEKYHTLMHIYEI